MSCILEPINLTESTQLAELQHQRNTCGWDNTPEKFAFWHKQQQAGLKSFFWITTASQPPVRAGHISLDAYAEPADPDLATKEKTNLTIQTFFILPEHRKSGLGGLAMRQIEALARQEPYGSINCQFITLNCMAKKHYYDEVLGPIVRRAMPICNQEWYERQGYVAWKEEARYKEVLFDGREIVFDAAFLRKKVD